MSFSEDAVPCDTPPTMESMDSTAEHVWAKLVALEEIDVPGLGVFIVRVLEAYEGVNPRNGARIQVPEKRQVLFMLDPAMQAHLRAGEALPAAAPPWLSELLTTLERKQQVAFGRVGILEMVRKRKAAAISFEPSEELLRAIAVDPSPR